MLLLDEDGFGVNAVAQFRDREGVVGFTVEDARDRPLARALRATPRNAWAGRFRSIPTHPGDDRRRACPGLTRPAPAL
jgi:hypothetical protein